jgi:hypothetical protein
VSNVKTQLAKGKTPLYYGRKTAFNPSTTTTTPTPRPQKQTGGTENIKS